MLLGVLPRAGVCGIPLQSTGRGAVETWPGDYYCASGQCQSRLSAVSELTGNMTNKSKSGVRAPPKAGSQPRSAERSRLAPRPAAPAARPGSDGDRASGGGRGGAGDRSVPARQGSVKDMIQRLDGTRAGSDRNRSPCKRPRSDPRRDSTSSSSSTDEASEQPLTEQTLRAVMKRMARQIRDDISTQFDSLRDEISKMGTRITDLERHVEERDNYIQDVEQRLQDRETRVAELEEEVDHFSSLSRRKDLILSGSAIPPAPAQIWTEDVTTTAVAVLSCCLPAIAVCKEDIEESYRIAKGKRIVCRFREVGKGSIRDRIYESRLSARPRAEGNTAGASRSSGSPVSALGDGGDLANDKGRPGMMTVTEGDVGHVTGGDGRRAGPGSGSAGPVLYINENLTRRRQEIFQALLTERRSGRLYTVFTKNGEVFCKTMQYGRKIRVDSMHKIAQILHE